MNYTTILLVSILIISSISYKFVNKIEQMEENINEYTDEQLGNILDFFDYIISSNNLKQMKTCYPNNGNYKCEDGYRPIISSSDIKLKACGAQCVGGQNLTDSDCNCACIPENKCSNKIDKPETTKLPNSANLLHARKCESLCNEGCPGVGCGRHCAFCWKYSSSTHGAARVGNGMCHRNGGLCNESCCRGTQAKQECLDSCMARRISVGIKCYPNNIVGQLGRKCKDGYKPIIRNKDIREWKCGENCKGGKYLTDSECKCVCIPEEECDKDSVLKNLPIPGGNWKDSGRNSKVEGNILKAELRTRNGRWIKAEIQFKEGDKFENSDGKFKKIMVR